VYPEDRVLVGVMPDPNDLTIAREKHWYRLPAMHAPKGIHAEYIAFYFTKRFSQDLRWAIHFYARRTGHELVRRVDLLPDQPNHPRAQEPYYKLQLGPLRQKEPPIVSLRWRRISFIQTTWDRFVTAQEINDLFRSDNILVERVYRALRERGILADRAVEIREGRSTYTVDLLIQCKHGVVILCAGPEEHPDSALILAENEQASLALIQTAIKKRGGAALIEKPLQNL
jgi:hypothetical protein